MSYELPPKEKLREIAARQDEKEKEIRKARAAEAATATTSHDDGPSDKKEAAAAAMIQVGGNQHSPSSNSDAETDDQRNYRGYRQRREMRGLGLSASTRWSEVSRILDGVLYLSNSW